MELYNGTITFQNYVQDPKKRVRVFDDPNFKMMDWEDIKNLFNGQEMTMKVLYDYKQVNPLPLIIIMNVPEFHKFLEKNKEYIGWINSNSKFVEVKHKLWLEDKPYNDEEPYYDLELKKFVFFKFNSFMSRRLNKSEQRMEIIDCDADESPKAMDIEKEPVLCADPEKLIIDLNKDDDIIIDKETSSEEDFRVLNEAAARRAREEREKLVNITPLNPNKKPPTTLS